MPITLTREDLTDGLRELGLSQGAAVEVHSSLSSLGFVQGGAETVIEALMEVVGPEGAIVMSAYPVTLPLPLTAAEKAMGIVAKVRRLDPDADTRTGMGAVADAFRKRPDTCLGKGNHRVCAWGRAAGLHSQGYAHLLAVDGWALLIGVDINRCSSMHLAEERVPYPPEIVKRLAVPRAIQEAYPDSEWYVAYNDPADPLPGDAWNKVAAEAERRGLIRRGRIGLADCLLFKAAAVVGIYEQFLCTDPYALFGIQK